MVGGSLKPPVNWPKIVEPMPTMTASTENLHARRDDIAEHLRSQERGADEESERNQNESGQARELELDQADEELGSPWTKKLMTTMIQGDQQDGDLDEIVEETGETHETGDGGQDGCCVDFDLGDASG